MKKDNLDIPHLKSLIGIPVIFLKLLRAHLSHEYINKVYTVVEAKTSAVKYKCDASHIHNFKFSLSHILKSKNQNTKIGEINCVL